VGGPGSGNWYRWEKKDTVDGYRNLDINRLLREGLLRHGRWVNWGWKNDLGNVSIRANSDKVELFYILNPESDDPEEVYYQVPLTWTSCNYGGKRPWFVCPGRSCNKRVGKLYLVGKYFLCRHCHGLVYESQREHKGFRLLHQSQKIMQRLGHTDPEQIFFLNNKPQGMHWKTYERLCQKAQEYDQAFLFAMARRFGKGAL
jgi:hypothetical protein